MSVETPFQRAYLSAAKPLQAAIPEIRIAVTPELVDALGAALKVCTCVITPSQYVELQVILLQASIVARRKTLS